MSMFPTGAVHSTDAAADQSYFSFSVCVGRLRVLNFLEYFFCGQVFYGILVQHFAMLAGSVPLPMDHLDALTVHLLDITGEVPFYAATVARARLSRLQQRLATALTNPVRDVFDFV